MLSLDWKSVSSLVATVVFLRSVVREFLPPEVKDFLRRCWQRLFSALQTKMSILIEEHDACYYPNELFDSAQAYLSSKCFSSAAQKLKLSKPKNTTSLTFNMDSDEHLPDTYRGIRVKWSLHCRERKSSSPYFRPLDARHFELSFHKRHKDDIRSLYLPFVIDEASRIMFNSRQRRLYTNRSSSDDDCGSSRYWSSVPFSHPSTFDTVAIDPQVKEEIKADLLKFVERKDFYSRVGRAWKRGYLLYGPPGTGKTSLIAAIANFLKFDIYDLELTAVSSNSQLRKLLISTSSKSVIVVEDIDCTLDLSDRKKPPPAEDDTEDDGEKKEKKKKKGSGSSNISLSGVLNFVDGLWSSCVGERLMIFTTNHREKLDTALLRSGRMDKQIHLGFCRFEAFKVLVWNYLELKWHPLMDEVEKVLPAAEITPADIAEVFMSCNDDVDLGMRNVLEEMKRQAAAIAEKKMEMEGMEKEMVVTEEGNVEERVEAEEVKKKEKTEECVKRQEEQI